MKNNEEFPQNQTTDELPEPMNCINLPLLFANGYPISLEEMTDVQLEKFIPFMIQCSQGGCGYNFRNKIECTKPEWWPESLPFSLPLVKPHEYSGNWIKKLKELVRICYQFYKCELLLKFCDDIASFERINLKFINNYNSTTSLFDRRSNTLLVTIRNNNIIYDQPQRQLQCLLEEMSPGPFDIYLCDKCEAELYSAEAMLDHENICSVFNENRNNDISDNDQIITNKFVKQTSSCIIPNNYNELREKFLLNFNLMPHHRNTKKMEDSSALVKLNDFAISHASESFNWQEEHNAKLCAERVTRQSRMKHPMLRYLSIPLTSEAGQLLLKKTNSCVSSEYITERLAYAEKYCYTPLLGTSNTTPEYIKMPQSTRTLRCTYKKTHERSSHLYKFPCRQYLQNWRRTRNHRLFRALKIQHCDRLSMTTN